MNMEEKEGMFTMKISDPEMVQKIRESGMESLSPDDLNSLGIEIKDGRLSLGDASQSDLDGTKRVRMHHADGYEVGPSPLRKGFIGFIAILFVVFIVLSVMGIISSKMFLPSFTYKDMIFLSLFIVVGIGICFNEFRVAASAKKHLTERVQGKCISIEHARGSGSLKSKRSIYEYTYRDQIYRSCENVFANVGYAKVGAIRELMIAPENPRFIYDPTAGKSRKVRAFFGGLIFIVIPAVIIACVYING